MAKEKKKVLFAATVDSHIELFHLPYLKMFHDKGWEVHVATDTGKKIQYCDKKIKLPIKRSPFKLVNNYKAMRKLREIMKKEGYSIVHCHTPMGGVVARMAGRKFRRQGQRMIYTAHGFHFYKGAPVHYWLMFYPVEWYLAKYTDTLITINNEDYERAKRKFSRRCRDIQYVPGVGVDEKKFEKKLSTKEKHALRESLGLKDDDRVLICVGRLDKNKNQGFLIRAMKELIVKDEKYQLLLVGPDELNGKYQKLADKLGVSDHVKFLGFRKDIPELLQISNIAVSSSKREGLPVNLIEAAMVGLSIVALDCRGCRDICKDGIGTIAKNNSETFFSDELSKIIKNPVLKQSSRRLDVLIRYGMNYTKKELHDKVYFTPKKLVFVHGCAWLGETRTGQFYNSGQYTKKIWDRYYAIADEVTVVLRKDNRLYNDDELIGKAQLFYKKNKIEPIYKSKCKYNLFEQYKVRKTNRSIVRNAVIKNDYVVARVPSLESCIAIKYASKYNKKIIVEVVGCAFDSLWNHGIIGKAAALPSYLIHRYFIRKASGVIYVTSSFLQRRYPVKGKRIGCSDVDIRCDYDIETRIQKIRASKTNQKRIVLGTVGSLETRYKGQEYVIRAMRELIADGFDLEYQLIGGGNRNYLSHVAEKYGVYKNVKFVGQLPHNKLSQWYKHIDIYIQPSVVEGLCRSIIEAMSVGCPCIVSDVGGNYELIRDEQYRFKKKSYKDIERIINDTSKNDLIRQAKRNYTVSKEYNPQLLATKRIGFMRSCIQ